MASTLPANAQKTNANTLAEALADTSLSSPSSEAKELNAQENSNTQEEELEDGEIKDDEEEDDGTVKTVFDNASKFNVKHPLYSNWTLYFDSPATKHLPKTPSTAPAAPGIAHGGWMDDIRKVVQFDSVEEFWGTYNNIVPPSQLPGKANYYLFKDNIMPAWEDAANKNGGKWAIQVPRDKTKGAIDRMWLYTMLAAIGETFETPLAKEGEEAPAPLQSDLVTGVICSARPGFYRLAIWTREAPDVTLSEENELMRRMMTIGRHFKVSVLGYELDQKLVTGGFQTEITFESHVNGEKKGNKLKLTI